MPVLFAQSFHSPVVLSGQVAYKIFLLLVYSLKHLQLQLIMTQQLHSNLPQILTFKD